MKKLIVFLAIVYWHTSSSQSFNNEEDFKKYFTENLSSLDNIEGLWSITEERTVYERGELKRHDINADIDNLAIVKLEDGYHTYHLNGKEQGIKFKETSDPNSFLVTSTGNLENVSFQFKANASLLSSAKLFFKYRIDDATLKAYLGKRLYISGIDWWENFTYIKLYPSAMEVAAKKTKSTGTGFAISSDGYLVTNFHVIKGAKTISIRGINGNFLSSLSAKIITEDKNNDIAIIKIDAFVNTDSLPYSFKTKSAEVGENIFVLGYPLTQTMGDEIKVTNGIISAKSGFQGDITSYQISAPIQPGNSGGPLIDRNGNIIGIVNAKHLETENVSYAVKSYYIQNLLDLADIKIPDGDNRLNNLSLVEQIQKIKKYVYLIDVTY